MNNNDNEMSSFPDPYYKKIVALNHGKKQLQFRVSQELFSSHEVDVGTKFLLRTLDNVALGHKVLDLGCGYGVLGLTLKALDKRRQVHLVDRDALAVAYTQQNAELNTLGTVHAYGSLGFDAVRQVDFDLIVSNIPGKVGDTAVAHFLTQSRHYLQPGGLVAIVVVNPLQALVAATLQAMADVTITLQKATPRYTVFHYRFEEELPSTTSSGLSHGIYQRDNITVSVGKLSYPMQTARGLPEFDSLSHASVLLVKAIEKMKGTAVSRILIHNPGQGHLPVAVWKLLAPPEIVLVDRDLLALRYSQLNLLAHHCPADRVALYHQVGMGEGEKVPELIICVLRDTEGVQGAKWVVQQAAALLVPGGMLLAAANSHLITQLTNHIKAEKLFQIQDRKKRKGYSSLVMQKKP
jgi:16S rRNA G1207 methylase RsmC